VGELLFIILLIGCASAAAIGVAGRFGGWPSAIATLLFVLAACGTGVAWFFIALGEALCENECTETSTDDVLATISLISFACAAAIAVGSAALGRGR
jgi:hypothetical protein